MHKQVKQSAILLLIIVASISVFKLFTASVDEEADRTALVDEFQEDYHVYALPMPKNLDFSGEKVPMELLDVSEKLDRELLINTYWQSQTMLFIKRSHRWFPVIEPILKAEGVPDDFKYLALIESGFQQVVSPAGATGFWQLMKAAAKENGLEVNAGIDERYHVEKSTYAACAYLKTAKEKFGTWTLAAASYNMGMAGLANQMDRQIATNYYDLVLNEETSRYVFRILAAKLILSKPASYGFVFNEQDLYPELKYTELKVNTTIKNLPEFAFQQGINYKALKFLNPWLRDDYLPNDSGREYILQIPTKPLSTVLINDKEQVATFARESRDEGAKKSE